MPPPPQEQHYNTDKLHKIFAIVTIVLLCALFGLFGRDFSKQWKEYQSRFRGLEIEKARVKADSEDVALSKNEEYQEILKQIVTAENNLKSKSADLAKINKAIETTQAAINISTQQSQFKKAELDAAKYAYEEARAHHSPEEQTLKKTIDTLAAQTAQLRLKIEADQRTLGAHNKAVADIQVEVKDSEKKRAVIAKKLDRGYKQS